MKRKNKVKIIWNNAFAYAIGLIATDGNLSTDGRHISFTSKDKGLTLLFKKCLGLKNKIGKKARESSKIKKYHVVQFGDKNFYEYLVSIGLTPKKSKTIGEIKIPESYFADFLRGCIDGDGNISVFKHKESRHKQLKLRLASASYKFLVWMHKIITKLCDIKGGYISKEKMKGVYTLSYGKADGGKILSFMYYKKHLPCLLRKRHIADKLNARVAK